MKGSVASVLMCFASMTAASAILAERGFDGMQAASASLAKRQGGTTRNDLIDGECKEVTVIFARGTTEAGNVGSIAGPPFFDALDDVLGRGTVAIQGVDYPADIAGYLAGGSREGARTMAGLVSEAVTKCPDTKIVISGYR